VRERVKMIIEVLKVFVEAKRLPLEAVRVTVEAARVFYVYLGLRVKCRRIVNSRTGRLCFR
jgi:hypothetical protein